MPFPRTTRALALGTLAWTGLVASGLVAASPGRAADVNYVELFRTRALPCLHRTVNADKADIEVIKPAATVGDVTTVRLKTYYAGLVRRNVMETDLLVRQAGSIRQMRIKTLSDTGTGAGSCSLENNWQDF